MVKVETGLNIS